MVLFRTSKENVVRDVDHVPFKDSLRNLKGNKPLYMLCASALSFLVGMFAMQSVQAYYARDVMGNANYYIALSLMTIATMFVVAPLVPKMVSTWGKKNTYIVGGVVSVVGGLVIGLTPADQTVVLFIGFGLMGIGLMIVNTLMWAMEADTVEYGEWRRGVRTEGTTYAVFSFTRKVAQAVGGAVGAYGLAIAGYVSGSDSQSTSTIDGIQLLTGLAPALFIGIGAVIMVRYPLTDARHKEIREEIAARRAAGITPEDAEKTES